MLEDGILQTETNSVAFSPQGYYTAYVAAAAGEMSDNFCDESVSGSQSNRSPQPLISGF
jgi:hypothetical protein